MATVHIVFGSQGAGKTTHARRLAEEVQATRFSIDDWMAELFGPDLPEPMSLSWIMERVRRCEKRIWATAADIAQHGGNVILDLGFMKVSDRSDFASRASALQLQVQRHFVTAALRVRRERVAARNSSQGETFAFEVTPAMFDFMEGRFEAPTEEELSKSSVIHTD